MRRRTLDGDWEHAALWADRVAKHHTRGFLYSHSGYLKPLYQFEPSPGDRIPMPRIFEDFVSRGWLRVYQGPDSVREIWVQPRLLRAVRRHDLEQRLFGGTPFPAKALLVIGGGLVSITVAILVALFTKLLDHFKLIERLLGGP